MPAIRLKEKIVLIIFGLVVGVVILEIGLRCGGWLFLSLQQYKNSVISKEQGAYRILCLGESTTARSIELDESESSYPSQLQEILNKSHPGKRFVVINAGVPGITTAGIIRQLPDNLGTYSPDMVITMMGINDRGDILPYEGTPLPGMLSFLRGYRVYKLAGLLWAHGASKLNELLDDYYLSIDDALPSTRNEEEARLRQAVETNPGSSKAYRELGSLYLDAARFKEAEDMFSRAIAADGGDDMACLEMGKCYLETARFREAEAFLQKALAVNPNNHEAYLELGLYYLHEGRLQEIEEMLKGIIDRVPGNDKAYALLGQYYLYVGKNREAEDILKRALELNPQNYHALLTLGSSYSNAARFREAEETYDRLDAIKPKTYEAYVTVGYSYLIAGRFPKGEELLLRAIAMDPHNYEPYRYLEYDCYFPSRRYADAENILKKAITMNPESCEAYLGMGQFYIIQGKYPAARAFLKKALRANQRRRIDYAGFESHGPSPGSLRTYTEIGGYYQKATRFREAERIYRQILDVNPQNYEICLQLGECHKNEGKLRDAEEAFTKAIAINAGESRAYFRLGCLYEIQARYEEAEQAWIKGLKANPANFHLHTQLAQLYTRQGRSQDAEKVLQGVREMRPQNYVSYPGPGDHGKPPAGFQEADEARTGKARDAIGTYIERMERLAIYKGATIDNYRKLSDMVRARGMQLVVVQYPCRSIEPLRNIFKDREGIIFVDNEYTFRKALQQGGYDEYFNDRFAGDFGHCTRTGNRLLAENIAQAIMKAGY